MSITVETGAVVSGANSFVSVNTFTAHCDSRNRDYSSYSDEQIEAALIQMADYLNSLPWKGMKTARANPMCWPRYGDTLEGWNEINQPASMWLGVVDADGYIIGTSEIPAEVVAAQNEGAWLILTGSVMEPTLDRGGQIKREKYDVIEFEYFSGAPATTEFKAVSNRLNGLLVSTTTREIVRA
jgi:hypothetical protein